MSKTLNELVQQLKDQQLLKRDMVVPSSCLSYSNGRLLIRNVSQNPEMDDLLKSTGVTMEDEQRTTLTLNPLDSFSRQVAGRFEIPFPYYKKMMQEENIPLLDQNVNHWFSTAKKNYLVRCFASTTDNTGVAREIGRAHV